MLWSFYVWRLGMEIYLAQNGHSESIITPRYTRFIPRGRIVIWLYNSTLSLIHFLSGYYILILINSQPSNFALQNISRGYREIHITMCIHFQFSCPQTTIPGKATPPEKTEYSLSTLPTHSSKCSLNNPTAAGAPFVVLIKTAPSHPDVRYPVKRALKSSEFSSSSTLWILISLSMI